MSRLKVLAAVGVIVGFCGLSCAAERVDVKIVNRQNNESAYSYNVAGRTDSTTRTKVKCREGDYSSGCTETTHTATQYVAPQHGDYSVQGSTLSLQLADGRIAVVNCASKLSLFTPTPQTRRSCRIPPGNNIQVEFKAKDAKLFWPVSIDGQKFESETYKIVAIEDAK
jgi:hypothetical protein